MRRAAPSLLFLAAACAAPERAAPPADAAPPVYAALPLRDLTGRPGATADMLWRVRAGLEGRGAAFVPEELLERTLRANRIRYTDSISRADARKLAAGTPARWLLLGTLLDYEAGLDPRVSLALRVVDIASGERVQSALVTLRGSDFTGLLELGTIEELDELADEAAVRALDMFDQEGRPRPAAARRRGGRPRALVEYHRPDFDPAELQRLTVLPLANRTERADAGLLMSEILAHEWFQRDVRVVEASELREALLRERVRSIERMDLDVLARVGRDLGTRYVALGSIDRYRREVFVGADRVPEIEASVRVLDVEQRRIVAAAALHRRGDHYRTVLGLGLVRDPVALADRLARELVAVVGG